MLGSGMLPVWSCGLLLGRRCGWLLSLLRGRDAGGVRHCLLGVLRHRLLEVRVR